MFTIKNRNYIIAATKKLGLEMLGKRSKKDIESLQEKIENLKKYASFDPSKMTHAASIHSLCQKIENEQLTIPVYQRNLSWTHAKAVELFNFQLQGKSAISAISIIEINNSIGNDEGVKQLKFITREPIKKSGRLQTVIDGQQRLSTNYKAYIGDKDFDRIVLDINIGEFCDIKNKTPNLRQIPVTKLLNKKSNELTEYLQEKYSTEDFNNIYPLLLQIRTKLHAYNYTINVAEDLSFQEQKEWFEVLNNAGTRVKGLQLALAEIDESYTFDIYDYFKSFKNIIESSSISVQKLYTPLSTQDSYPMCALNPWYEVYFETDIKDHKFNFAPFPSDAKPEVIIKLKQNEIEEIINKTLESLKIALNFLEEYKLIEKINRIDYILYLIGFLAFNQNHIPDHKNIVKWVEDTDFSNLDNGKRREVFKKLINQDF